MLLLIFTVKAKAAILNSDSLMQALENLPQKQQAVALPTYSIALLSTDKSTALKLANEYLHLSSGWVSNQQKQAFFKTLAHSLEKTQDFQQALFYYKIADSIVKVNIPTAKAKQLIKTKTRPFAWFFYLFILFSSFGLALIVYSWNWRRRFVQSLHALDKEKTMAEEEISQLQANLNKEIKAETGDIQSKLTNLHKKEFDLKSSLKKAEEASYLRNAFIANLGFDVRTPLNGIIGFANMMETDLAVLENQELYEYAANIGQSGGRLLKLMNNVIDLSSLESNTLELTIKDVSLEIILQRIHNQYKGIAQKKGLIFKSKIDDELHAARADEDGLEKAILQVVDNAIRYTDQGFVTISSLYDQEKDIDIIEIKDTGPGIEKPKQSLLFETELSADTEQVKYTHGTGIGLKLAKKLIDLMQGRIELISTPGKGTTVRIFIPCSDKAIILDKETIRREPMGEREVTTAAELGELDIFVVEDDRMNRLILEKMLTKLGQVTLTVDGDDCMNTIDQEAQKGHFFQVMLFDINLPGDWDGVKLMKEIRKKYPEYLLIPFIAQTAYAMAGDKDHFLKEGFDSYLSKPIDQNELISTIKQQLSIHQKS